VHAARPIAAHPLMGSSLRQAFVSHHAQPVLQPPLSVPASMTLSSSCPHHLDSQYLDSSLDSLQLTQVEIDNIRNLGRPSRGSGASSPSTPTSQLSHPDFVDPRPDIYRFVYDISPGSRSRTSDSASASAEGVESRPAAELQLGSKFDDVVISSMEQSSVRRHKVKIESESREAGETSLKRTVEHSELESAPTCTESAVTILTAETYVAIASVSAPDQTNEMVVSVGDALVAVQQGTEVLVPEDSSDVQQLPVTTSVDMSSAAAARLRDSTSLRFHKGICVTCISAMLYDPYLCAFFSYKLISCITFEQQGGQTFPSTGHLQHPCSLSKLSHLAKNEFNKKRIC